MECGCNSSYHFYQYIANEEEKHNLSGTFNELLNRIKPKERTNGVSLHFVLKCKTLSCTILRIWHSGYQNKNN